MKALTSKEVWERIDKEPKPFDQTIEEAVRLARIGMIHEDEAVRVPLVSEWPESARQTSCAT